MAIERREPGLQQYYTVPEMCEKLRLSRTTVYELAKSGKLPRIYIGASLRFPARAVDVYLASLESADGGMSA